MRVSIGLRGEFTMELDELLKFGMQKKASDVHIKSGCPPIFRIFGELYRANTPPLSEEEAKRLIYSALKDEEREKFERTKELDTAYVIPGVARFRVNCYYQRGRIGAAFRIIPLKVPTIDELGLPPVVKEFCERPRGFIVVTGPAGSGKTTTQAAMINYINERFPCHIITVEDPIEFVFEDKQAIINQRELYQDTHSFANALRAALREDPDVILVGEMRDLETIALAITAAETGHLVISTLHTTDAIGTIDRIIDVFPTHQQQQIRVQLSMNLVGIIAQRLLKRADGKGMVAAFEILVGTPAVRALIRDGKTPQLFSILQTGMKQGMTTLERYLADLVMNGIVTKEEAMAHANDPDQLEELLAGKEVAVASNPSAGGE